jgi:hypothetical protein
MSIINCLTFLKTIFQQPLLFLLSFVHSQLINEMSEPFQAIRKTLTFTQKNSGTP